MDIDPLMLAVAYSADFAWRRGAAIARSAKAMCLLFRGREESVKLWGKGDMTIEKVKAFRREEAERAAYILDAEVEFFNIPKMCSIAESRNGAISTRSFIPPRPHVSIDVPAAASVTTAALLRKVCWMFAGVMASTKGAS